VQLTEKARGAPAQSEVDLAKVESATRELLRQYRTALQYVTDMPLLGPSPVTGKRWRRWGSRFYTRVYLETHVRKQLRAVSDCLRLELLGREEENEKQRIVALEDELAGNVEPLFRWRRLIGLVARLPPVAAALPILSAASVWPLADDVSGRTVVYAVLVLAGTALGLWILVVWPSIRLGFRVKRAIFAGGRDYHHPFLSTPDWLDWEGFAAPTFFDDDEPPERQRMPFPAIHVYKAENAVFRKLGRRKPTEVPLDLLLGFTPYLWFAYSAFFTYGLIDVLVEGELWKTITESGFGLFFGALLAVFGLLLPRQGLKNYRTRPH
jgi:hypothetical protein